jgi:RNA-directed DNA polymerase
VGSYGYRPKRTAHEAVDRVAVEISHGKTQIIDVDLRAYFDNVRHDLLMKKVAERICDAEILHLLKLILKASGKKGVPQGGVISPLLSNLYLNEVDKMLEKAKEVTRTGKWTHIEYARFADDLVILIDGHPRHNWLLKAVDKRLREEFAKLHVELNEEKSRTVDLTRDESFGFLGFEFRRVRSRKGTWYAYKIPKLKKRTDLLQKLKEVFHHYRSQPLSRVIAEINPILRGWVRYFAIGNSNRCFAYVRWWVEKKVRRHLMRARERPGFGWRMWSTQWFYRELGLYGDYRIRYFSTLRKATPT